MDGCRRSEIVGLDDGGSWYSITASDGGDRLPWGPLDGGAAVPTPIAPPGRFGGIGGDRLAAPCDTGTRGGAAGRGRRSGKLRGLWSKRAALHAVDRRSRSRLDGPGRLGAACTGKWIVVEAR